MPRCVHASGVCHPAPRRAGAPCRRAHQEGLANLLDRGRFFTHRHRQGRHADRTTAETAGKRREHGAVQAVETEFVDVVDLHRGLGDVAGDHAVCADLGVVPDPAQQPVGDAGRAAGAPGDLRARLDTQLDAEDAGRAASTRSSSTGS